MSIFGVNLLLEVIVQEWEIHSRRGVKETFCAKQRHHRWQRQLTPAGAVLKLHESMLFAAGNIFFLDTV